MNDDTGKRSGGSARTALYRTRRGRLLLALAPAMATVPLSFSYFREDGWLVGIVSAVGIFLFAAVISYLGNIALARGDEEAEKLIERRKREQP